MEPCHVIKYEVVRTEKREVRIFSEEYGEDPREWDCHVTNFICFHNRYRLGDKHDYRKDDYNSWDELEAQIRKDEKVVFCESLYMYDHGGVTVSLSPFLCPWDSGQIGFVVTTREHVKKCFGWDIITKKRRERLYEALQCDVEVYDQYLRGMVYRFETYDEKDEMIDSCGGFYGTDWEKNGLLDTAGVTPQKPVKRKKA